MDRSAKAATLVPAAEPQVTSPMVSASAEVPSLELGATVTPSPHHPIGAKGIGESATVGSPAAVVNSVMDALAPLGVRHADMPLTPAVVWRAVQGRPFRTDLATW